MGTIKIKNLTFKYNNMEKNIFNACNLNIDEHWKLGLIGRNGRGKTTFLRLLRGGLVYQGTIQTNLKFDYFPQVVATPQYSVKEVLQQLTKLDDSEFWRLELELEKLKLPAAVLTMAFKNLSPGQQTKSLLAAIFVDRTAFQLIDEPTNHLDSWGRQVVSQYLKTKQGFILTSHDQNFIDQSVDHILAIDRNKLQLFQGNYATWQQEFAKQNQTEKLEKQQLNRQIKHLQQNANEIHQWSERAEKEKRKKFHQREEHADINRGFLGHRAAKVMKRSNSNLKKLPQKLKKSSHC
ncbi:ATP-binding cassette domain-containing protein [Liquorilactobacillus vini]|uniref:ATP-binding cassette domain-containing protein n=1 Tax=Liquorilactobacillus vini TaxID=238015 RepID=UPI000319A0EB|nr:ATP-binding cassette domain-containing protein [Liquorilactobacillus vini]